MERLRSTIAALAILFTASPALADREYTQWGITPAQVAAASSGNVKVLPERKAAGAYFDSRKGIVDEPRRRASSAARRINKDYFARLVLG